MAIEKVNKDGLSSILERIIQQKGRQDYISRYEMFLVKVNKIIEETRTNIINSIRGNEINKKTSIQ